MSTAQDGKQWVLVAMTGTLVIILVNQAVLCISLPQIKNDLDMSQANLQWVMNAYMLALTATIAIGGRLGEIVGRVRTFFIGAVVFALASVMCGMAPNEFVMIIARALQGIGAAFIIPTSPALVSDSFQPHERAKSIAIYTSVAHIFVIVRPLIGGILTEYISWRWGFYINLPIVAAAVALILLARPVDKVVNGRPFHIPGLALFVVGMSTFVFGLQQGSTWSWTSPVTLGTMVGGIFLISTFIYTQTRVKNPLIEMRLFFDHSFTADTIIIFCTQLALVSIIVFNTIYMQNTLGFSPLTAGVALTPIMIPMVITSQFASHFFNSNCVGFKTPAVIGTALVVIGLFLHAPILAGQSFAWIFPGMVIFGLGAGLAMVPANTDALERAPKVLRVQASGVIQTLRHMGGAIGIAVVGGFIGTADESKVSDSITGISESPFDKTNIINLLANDEDFQIMAIHEITSTLSTAFGGLQNAIQQSLITNYFLAGIILVFAFLVAISLMRLSTQK